MIEEALESLKFKANWKLILFGSCSIGFALKESDLDLIVEVDEAEMLTLGEIFDGLKTKEWVTDCKIISSARMPIVTFSVDACFGRKAIKNRQDVSINVDISISTVSEVHDGLANTKYLGEIFEETEDLRTISIILK